MPTSNIDHIPIIIKTVRLLKPKSILDIGCGFGKYGFLFREQLDICDDQKENIIDYKIDKINWRRRIDAVEIFKNYICDIQRYIYNNIYIGNITDLTHKLDNYDIILLADVLEHFVKKEGNKLLDEIYEKASKLVIITTPFYEYFQGKFLGNEFERHRSTWRAIDFKRFKNYKLVNINNESLCVFISKDSRKFKLPKLKEGLSINERIKILTYNLCGNSFGDFFVSFIRRIKKWKN